MALSLEDYVLANPPKNQAEIKVAFFDVDGTLLGLDGRYSQQLEKSIHRIQRLGVKTAIASGRPAFATEFLWSGLKLIDAGAFCTGAQIYEPRNSKLHQLHLIPEYIVTSLLAAIRVAGIYYELYTEQGVHIDHNIAPEICAVHAKHLRTRPVNANLDRYTGSVIKLLIGVNTEVDSVSLSAIENLFPECIFAYASLPAYPNWKFASIISAKATKKAAFDYLLNYFGVEAKNVISFGDAQSDCEFIQMAGIGVALGNGSVVVKEVADIVTAAVWEDGVAKALDTLCV